MADNRFGRTVCLGGVTSRVGRQVYFLVFFDLYNLYFLYFLRFKKYKKYKAKGNGKNRGF